MGDNLISHDVFVTPPLPSHTASVLRCWVENVGSWVHLRGYLLLLHVRTSIGMHAKRNMMDVARCPSLTVTLSASLIELTEVEPTDRASSVACQKMLVHT